MLRGLYILHQAHQFTVNFVGSELHAHADHAGGQRGDLWFKVPGVVRNHDPICRGRDGVNSGIGGAGLAEVVRDVLNVAVTVQARKRLPGSEAFI